MSTLVRTSLSGASAHTYHGAVKRPGEGVRRTDIGIMAGSLVLILIATIGHYTTPTSSIPWHDTFRRLYYLPIVMMGVRFGLMAGLGTGIFVAIIYMPHFYTHWGGNPLSESNLNRTLEVLMWVAVGGLTGFLAEREHRAVMREGEARREAEKSGRAAREATRALIQVQDQLRRADRLTTLGRLSASLAHEIRNPLGSLRGIADTLRRDNLPEATHRELVGILDEEVVRLDNVVEEFLKSARPTRTQGPSPVRKEAEAVRDLLAYECQKTGSWIEVDIAPASLHAPLSSDLLRQVLLNLTLNSLQSVSNGGRVEIRGQTREGRVEISVEDRGPGYPETILQDGARPFFTTREHGTGLGLTITREIVESHGGTLVLENRSDGGARTRIIFEDGSDQA